MTQFIPVIISGGSGTRLWPVSRTHFPKQFCDLFEESLFTKTVKRLQPLGSPWVVTNQSLKILTESVLRDLQVPTNQAIYETRANNTAPAIALLCKVLELNHRSNSIAGVFASDHIIQNEEIFQDAVRLAIDCAKKKQVVTLGIQPSFPATGYGYIEVGETRVAASGVLQAFPTLGFREKPNEQTAKNFISSGNFFWNAGMFIFEVATMISHFETLMPTLWKIMGGLKSDFSNLKEIYDEVAAPANARVCMTSIDYGIMEKLKEQVCIPCDLNWSDVGSWDEIAKLNPSDPTIQVQGKNNYAFVETPKGTKQKIISFVGVDDLIAIDTADALLITKRGSTQNVKSVVEVLAQNKDPRAHEHPFEFRPWGTFEILRDTDSFKSKMIQVNPGHQLSYQSHKKRAEHWVIIKGHPEVTLNDEVKKLNPGENIYIPLGAKHRIRNPHPTEIVEFIEVQVGTYFGEDDITRYQDDYHRDAKT